MKKKIIQWFIGLLWCFIGVLWACCILASIFYFTYMLNTSGIEFVICLYFGLVELAGFVFIPYKFFDKLKNGVNKKWK